jgi:hypothetical protein
MIIYKVQLVLDGKLDGVEENIQAPTEKDAAEQIAGRLLFKQGPSKNVRAMVRTATTDRQTLFYQR